MYDGKYANRFIVLTLKGNLKKDSSHSLQYPSLSHSFFNITLSKQIPLKTVERMLERLHTSCHVQVNMLWSYEAACGNIAINSKDCNFSIESTLQLFDGVTADISK
eukprot:TRINITY_DN12419_c0_g1_i2.p5 TRINITY_DN12419_c0_g1~~TRINITY_DN12419_c0_g1_i2.p5  ORF type:complete len:106 (-),score=15.17 TRINITY_DN12419_c0_g1_i2:1156-1473(-)